MPKPILLTKKNEAVLLHEMDQLILAISHEPDRTCAIVALIRIDQALERLLKKIMIPSPTQNDAIFRGLLRDQQAKEELAYRLGLMSSSDYKQCKRMRQIRNKFAHHPRISRFTTPKIREILAKAPAPPTTVSLLRNLPHDSKQRREFIAHSLIIISNLAIATATATKMPRSIPRSHLDIFEALRKT